MVGNYRSGNRCIANFFSNWNGSVRLVLLPEYLYPLFDRLYFSPVLSDMKSGITLVDQGQVGAPNNDTVRFRDHRRFCFAQWISDQSDHLPFRDLATQRHENPQNPTLWGS